MNKINTVGQRFGRLLVIEQYSRNQKTRCICRCDCGNISDIAQSSLRNGDTKSCGCIRREITKKRFITHGLRHSPEYGIWAAIKRRCYLATSMDYKNYGARGIGMSDEWRNSFECFYRDLGPRPSSLHSIERENNNGDYTKENCRWATRREQAQNTRRSRLYRFNNKEYTLAQIFAAERPKMTYRTFRSRVEDLGWSVQRSIETPVRKRGV